MNKDLLKVIAGLECCRDANGNLRCEMCPYDIEDDGDIVDCIGNIMTDALTILREVERDGLY